MMFNPYTNGRKSMDFPGVISRISGDISGQITRHNSKSRILAILGGIPLLNQRFRVSSAIVIICPDTWIRRCFFLGFRDFESSKSTLVFLSFQTI